MPAAVRQRIEHFAERAGAVEAANAFEQARHTDHFQLALAHPGRGDRALDRLGGARLRVGQGRLHARFGRGQLVAHLLLDFGLDLVADLPGRDVAVFGARPLDRLIHRRAHARLGIGDPRLRGLLGVGERGLARRAHGGVAFFGGVLQHLADERAERLID